MPSHPTLMAAALLALLVMSASVVGAAEKKDKDAKEPGPFKVLVFSKTKGFRHDSIETGVEAVKKLGAENGFLVDATEDAAQFNVPYLKTVQVVMFLNTTGNDILDADQKKILEEYIRIGHGWVGVHSASDTEYEWPFYASLVGAHFKSHPHNQTARLEVVDRTHPATAHLGQVWERHDEWYNFRKPPSEVQVLLKLDEASYQGGENAGNHPASWCHAVDAGRAFYTALGHTKESYAEPAFLKHLLGGILYASGTLEKPAKGRKKK